MSANARIEELRRRVQADPTSIAFAALAEEYRRAGQHDEAIEVCRNGLTRHPAYISARVTLGRALIELNRLEEAKAELTEVLRIAPENLAAIRAQAEIHARKGHRPEPPAAPEAQPSSGPFELDLINALPARPFGGAPSDPEPVETLEPAPAPDTAALIALEGFLQGILASKARRITAQA